MKFDAKRTLTFLLFLFPVFSFSEDFESTALELANGSYSTKAKIIKSLAEYDDPRTLPTFIALLDARLYFHKKTGNLVIVEKKEEKVFAKNLNDGADMGVVNEENIKKIRINNKLRRILKPKIALLQLTSKKASLRLSSAVNLARNPNENMREIIDHALTVEPSKKIKAVLERALASLDVNNEDPRIRKNALLVLSRSVEPESVAILKGLSEKDENGHYLEEDKEIAALADAYLEKANSKVSLFKFIENIIFGFSLGSILLLAAIGLAITFGVMGVINMAHGEMIMLGAYTTFAMQQMFPAWVEWSLLLAIPAAFCVSGLAGILIERLIIRHLYGRTLDTLLATFGISLILQQAVRMYSSNNVAVETPQWLSGFWQVNGAMALTYNRIYILIFSLIVLMGLALILKKTLLGLQMRAVTQNRPMANSMGIRSSRVDALTFGLGSGIAGIAGVALSQITNVGPNLGQGYIIDSFMVVVFGGVGNLLGTFFAAMSLGVANKLLEPSVGAVVGKIIVLVFIILFIQWRPRGLFALKGRFVED